MPNRYVCDVLSEMRTMHKTRNYSGLMGLIEEAQTLVNRMEAALSDKKGYQHWHEKSKKEQANYKELVKEANKLRKELGKDQIEPINW